MSEPYSTQSVASLEFRALAEVIPQLVFVSGPDGRPEYFNRRWLDFTGESAADFWHRVHPEDRGLASARWSEAIANGLMYEAEFRFLRKDQVYRWFLSRAVPLRGAEGEVVRWFGTCTDIHDAKQSQVASHFLAEASEALASSLDYEATLATVARLAVPRFADWASIDLLTSENTVHRVEVAHTDPEKVQLGWELARKYPVNLSDAAGLAGVLKTGRSDFVPAMPSFENLISDPELLRIMKELQLRASITVPMLARGRILGGITFVMAESGRSYGEADLVTAEDLGRRAGVAVDNARLYKESITLNRMKDEFLSTLSHELRTPMTAVLGWAQMLDSGRATGDSAKKGIGVILRNARAQAQLIDDLLDVSRIITGKLRLELAKVDLNDIARAAEDTLRPTADAKGVSLVSTLPPDPSEVNGDRDRLHQIFWNLLSNAVKFTPRGGQVTLKVSRTPGSFRIEVSDSGQGISPDFLPHVFERFRQQDASATRREGGLGLGLAVVRHLVELHGGTVAASSPGHGRGSTFVVELPERLAFAEQALPADKTARTGEAPDPQSGEAVLAGLRVLVVDDQPDARELVQEVLESRGARVITAGSAAEGLARFLEKTPDVLVTDLGMAGDDGIALLYRVRAAAPASATPVPAIALTAYARQEDVAAVMRAGFQRHLAKPIDPDTLVAAVAEVALKKTARR